MIIHGHNPPGGFEIIYADPPWKFSSNSKAKPGRNAQRHYDCMALPDILAMPVAEIAAKDALLFLWATSPMLPEGLATLKAWGFRYVSSLVWHKDRVGTGYWVRNEHEFVLIGKRGRFPCGRKAPFARSVLRGGQAQHSAKPPQLMDRIDAIWPERPRLEMFARQWRLGWSVHGNEVPHAGEVRNGDRGAGVHQKPAGAGSVRCDDAAAAILVPGQDTDRGRVGQDRGQEDRVAEEQA